MLGTHGLPGGLRIVSKNVGLSANGQTLYVMALPVAGCHTAGPRSGNTTSGYTSAWGSCRVPLKSSEAPSKA